jgi:hypothetical protein
VLTVIALPNISKSLLIVPCPAIQKHQSDLHNLSQAYSHGIADIDNRHVQLNLLLTNSRLVSHICPADLAVVMDVGVVVVLQDWPETLSDPLLVSFRFY